MLLKHTVVRSFTPQVWTVSKRRSCLECKDTRRSAFRSNIKAENGWHESRNPRAIVLTSCSMRDYGAEDIDAIPLQDTVQTLLPELTSVDFPREEVRLYLSMAQKPPKDFPDFDMSRTLPVFDELVKRQRAAAIEDAEALTVLKSVLTSLWRWKRRGLHYKHPELPIHMAALQDLQNVVPDDSEKITSALLDDLPISDEEKAGLTGTVQTIAVAGIQSIVWNGIALAVLFLVGFNYLLLKQ